MGFGVSFLDDEQDQGQPREKHQQSIEVLSMRVPRVVGGGAMAPAPLLQGMGGGGSPFGQSAVAQAFAQMAGLPPQQGRGQSPNARPMAPRPMAPQAMPPRMAPQTPRIIPGITSQAEQQAPPMDMGPNAPGWTPPPNYPGGQQVGTLAFDPMSELQQLARQRNPWIPGVAQTI